MALGGGQWQVGRETKLVEQMHKWAMGVCTYVVTADGCVT